MEPFHRRALAAGCVLALLCVAAVPARVLCAEASTTFDYGTVTGTLSRHLAGTTEGPFYNEESYPYLQRGGFKLVQVIVWLSPQPPRELPDGMSRRPFDGRGERRESGGPGPGREFPQRNRPGQDGRGGGIGGPQFEMSLRTAGQQVASLIRAGADPLVFMTAGNKPPDPDAFQDLVKKAVADLRSAARDAGGDLLLFRFANEPEARRFWGGSREDFFETYRLWATAVKSVSPAFLVEAPGFASATERTFRDQHYDEVNDFTREFLRYCKDRRVPLDIFSFHYYGTSLANLEKEIRAVKAELARYPTLSPIYGEPRIGIDEWNIEVFGIESGRYQKVFDTTHTAAHNVAALILMARDRVALSIRFGGVNARRTQDSGGGERGGGLPPLAVEPDFLMVDGKGGPKPVLAGFKAFNRLHATPDLLAIRDEKGQLALAGKSADGRGITAVVSAYDPALAKRTVDENRTDLRTEGGAAEIRIRDLPWQRMEEGVTVKTWIVDGTGDLAPLETRVVARQRPGEELVCRFPRIVPSVALVQLTW